MGTALDIPGAFGGGNGGAGIDVVRYYVEA